MNPFSFQDFAKQNTSSIDNKLNAIVLAKQQKIQELSALYNRLPEPNAQEVLDRDTLYGSSGKITRPFGTKLQDIGLSAAQGFTSLGKLISIPHDYIHEGRPYGSVTQRFSELNDALEKQKSETAQATNRLMNTDAVKAGETFKSKVDNETLKTSAQIAGEFGSSFWDSLTDVEMLPDTIAGQIASLGTIGKAGSLATRGAVELAEALPKVAATKAGQYAVDKAGIGAALGTASVLQGVDVGSDAKQRLMSLSDETWNNNPEYVALSKKIGTQAAKEELSSNAASKATLLAGGASLLTQALPGGSVLEKALVGKPISGIKQIPKAFVGEATQEGTEEGLGQASSNLMVNSIDPNQKIADGVGIAAGQGASLGGILGGGINAIGVMANRKSSKSIAEVSPDKTVAFEEASKTGDISPLMDKASPLYDPPTAMRALLNHTLADTTSPEIKQDNLTKAGAVISNLTELKTQYQKQLNFSSPEFVANAIAQRTEALNNTTNEEIRTSMSSLINTLQNHLNAITETPVSEEELSDIKAKLKLTDEHLNASQNTFQELNQEYQLQASKQPSENISVSDNTITSAVDTNAPSKTIHLSMVSPTAVEASTASTLANDNSNKLTPKEREYLNTFSANKAYDNKLKSLSTYNNSVYFGDKTTKGAAQYKANIAAALSSNNENIAVSELKDFIQFAESISNKNNKIQDAFKAYQTDNVPRVVYKDATNNWQMISKEMFDKSKQKPANSFIVNSDNVSLIEEINTIPDALNSFKKEIESAISLKFNTNQNVQNLQTTTDKNIKESIEAKTQSETSTDSGIRLRELPNTEKSKTSEESNSTNGLNQSFSEIDLLQEYFTKKEVQDNVKSKNPLIEVESFFTQSEVPVVDFLSNKDLTPQQEKAISVFKASIKNWDSTIRNNLVRVNRKYRYKDMIQYLLTENDGKLDLHENTKIAMSYSAYNFVMSLIGLKDIASPEEINLILRRDPDTRVSVEEYNLLGDVGLRQNVAVSSLGKVAIKALGLKMKPNAPKNLEAQLENSLGAHILKLLLDTGIVTRTSVTGNELAPFMDNQNTDKNATFYFIKINSNATGFLPQVKTIVDSQVNSGSVLDKLFNIEPSLKEPSLTPIPFVQRSTKNTEQKVPKELAKILAKENSTANYIRQDSLKVLNALGKDVLLKIGGVKNINVSKIHRANRKSQESKNAVIEKEITNFLDYANKLEDISIPLYFDHTVWKQQRVGIATNLINPQSSKIHRKLLSRKSWNTKVNFNNQDELNNFRLRVLEGFGVKTDKEINETSLRGYDTKINTPIVQDAVEALRQAIYDGSIKDKDKTSIENAVALGGEAFHTLDALIALAHEKEALDNKKDSFNTQLSGEIDGVTNGPMLSLLMLGAESNLEDLFETLNRGGFYKVGDIAKNYNVYRALPGNKDLYEKVSEDMVKAIRQLINKDYLAQEALGPIYSFIGDLNSNTPESLKKQRDIIKTPLTAIIFGSSVESAVNSMADAFIESIYAAIENASNSGSNTEFLLTNLNNLLSLGNVSPLTAVSAKELMETELRLNQVKALKDIFKKTIGKGVETAVHINFKSFINKRNTLNQAAQLSFELYDSVYKVLKESYIQELIKDKKIDTDQNGNPILDLTSAQDKELRSRIADMQPIMHTPMSKKSNDLRSGLYAAKTGPKLAEDTQYKSQISFNSSFKDNKASSVRVSALITEEENPGVAMVIMGIHSTDSAISHSAIKNNEILNIHDAHGSGLGSFQSVAANLNEATYKTMLEYSLPNEIHQMLSRTTIGLSKFLKENQGSPTLIASIKEAIKKVSTKLKIPNEDLLSTILTDTKLVAYESTKLKLEFLSTVQAVDQYALEDGQYNVTEEDRTKAKEQLKALDSSLTKEENEALAALNTLNKQSAFYQSLGKASIPSDPMLIKFFNKNPNATLEQVVNLLDNSNRLNAINKKLLSLISRTLTKNNPTIKIRYVTSDTDPRSLLGVIPNNSRGWFVATKEGKTEIYVLSPEFKNSGLTSELLLHELIHASVAQTIESPSKDAKELVAELQDLQQLASNYAKANKLTEFDSPLNNIQEFVAWGMTNREFQSKVLNKIKYESKTKNNLLVTLMQKFIDVLAKLLFSKPNEQVHNGLAVLISNVSGLFYEASQINNNNKDISLSMESVSAINDYNTLEIHEILPRKGVSELFSQHLAKVLTKLSEKLHGPFGELFSEMRKTEADSPLDVWLKALESGKAPFATEIGTVGMVTSSQELFTIEQVEATVRTALEDNSITGTRAFKELYHLYNESRNAISEQDFLDVGLTKEDYKFVFTIKKSSDTNQRSNYLSRFAALGLGHEKFNKLLSNVTTTKLYEENRTLFEKLVNFFDKVLNYFNKQTTNVYSKQLGDSKLLSLLDTLVDIEAKNRNKLKMEQSGGNAFIEKLEDKTTEFVNNVKTKIGEFVDIPFIRDSKNSFIRLSGNLTKIVTLGYTDVLLDTLRDFRDYENKKKDGWVIGLVRDVKGPLDAFRSLLLGVKHREQTRKNIITQHTNVVLQNFKDLGKHLTHEDKAAISSVFLRSGAHNLLKDFSLIEIEDILSNPDTLKSTISKYESKLTSVLKDVHIQQAINLGNYRATGNNNATWLMLNSYVIARMLGTNYASKITELEAATQEDIIKTLVSLQAIRFTDKSILNKAIEVLKTENLRTDGNGVELTLKLTQELENKSLVELFHNNPIQMVHGYVPEITNRHIAIKVVNNNEGSSLISQGYVKAFDLDKDSADPNTESRSLFIQKDGGMMPWVSGLISLTNLKSKGSEAREGYLELSVKNIDDSENQQTITNTKLKALSANITTEFSNNLAPVYDDTGKVSGWRYLMKERTKDLVLERNNNFNEIVGALAGSIFDKPSSNAQNEEVIKSLREQYELDRKKINYSYITVGSEVSDPEIRELWNMLPTNTKQLVRKVWGRDSMQVRIDSLDIIFGYRKTSIADFLRKNVEDLQGLSRVARNFFNSYAKSQGKSDIEADNMAKRLGLAILKGERGWQDIVKEIKDLVVVKNLFTLLGNVFANDSLLFLLGVDDRWKNQAIAAKGVLDYQKAKNRLAEIDIYLKTGVSYGDKDALEQESIQLNDLIDRNPVKSLIDAGLLPAIVEEINIEDDKYSYKSLLSKKVDSLTNKIPSSIKTAGRLAYLSHDTKAYQFLYKSTQYSDFIARYALYQHLISRKKNKLTHEQAILEASNTFVNYDIPLQRTLQWGDDMGFTPFLKFFLRIQRVLFKGIKENPLRALTLIILDKLIGLGPIITDSSFVHSIGNNPISLGALNYPNAVGESLPINAVSKLF